MDDFSLLIDLHKANARQGPGGDTETALALTLTGLDPAQPLAIADIGCGTGASTLTLARLLPKAQITAVDFLPEFLEVLSQQAQHAGLAERISPLPCAMDDLPFAAGALDLIWSEGAIYNIGFQTGITAWRLFLKPGGLLVASEITWTRTDRPAEIEAHWATEYPEIDTAAAKIAQLERHGYSPQGYFTLPAACWLDNYYRPLQAQFSAFLTRHHDSAEAQAIIAAEQEEIALYERYGDYYSYGVYIARRID